MAPPKAWGMATASSARWTANSRSARTLMPHAGRTADIAAGRAALQEEPRRGRELVPARARLARDRRPRAGPVATRTRRLAAVSPVPRRQAHGGHAHTR